MSVRADSTHLRLQSPVRGAAVVVLSVLVGLGIVLLGPWWDLGLFGAANELCAADELDVVVALRRLVPARLGCAVDGRTLATDGAAAVQAALLVYAVALLGPAARRVRVAGAVTVTALFVVGGALAYDGFEARATFGAAVLLGPPIALAVLVATGRASFAGWFLLTLASWTGYVVAWSIWAFDVTVAAALPVGAVVATGLDAAAARVAKSRRSARTGTAAVGSSGNG